MNASMRVRLPNSKRKGAVIDLAQLDALKNVIDGCSLVVAAECENVNYQRLCYLCRILKIKPTRDERSERKWEGAVAIRKVWHRKGKDARGRVGLFISLHNELRSEDKVAVHYSDNQIVIKKVETNK